MVHLASFYSTTGRPALNHPQIIRSLTLMLHLGVATRSIFISLMCTGMTVSMKLFRQKNSGIFVWIPPMTIIPPINCAKLGKSGRSLISIPKVEEPNPFRIPSRLLPIKHLYVRRVTAWFTGDSVQSAHVVNANLLLHVKRKRTVPAEIPAHLPLRPLYLYKARMGYPSLYSCPKGNNLI